MRYKAKGKGRKGKWSRGGKIKRYGVSRGGVRL